MRDANPIEQDAAEAVSDALGLDVTEVRDGLAELEGTK